MITIKLRFLTIQENTHFKIINGHNNETISTMFKYDTLIILKNKSDSFEDENSK